MTSYLVVVVDDNAVFDPTSFTPAIITEIPDGAMQNTPQSTSSAKLGEKAVCLKGDEAMVMVQCSYTTSTLTTQGSGMVKISKLADDHVAKKTKFNGKPVLLSGAAGSSFEAEFSVLSPAIDPSGSTVEPGLPYKGKGCFDSQNNSTWKVT